MPQFNSSEGIRRQTEAMTTGAGEAPFIAQMHEFAMREWGIPDDEFALGYIEPQQKLTIKPAVCDNWWGDSYPDDRHRFWEQKLRATPQYLKVKDPDLFRIGVQPVIDYATGHDLTWCSASTTTCSRTDQRKKEEEIRMRVHEYMEAVESARVACTCVPYRP